MKLALFVATVYTVLSVSRANYADTFNKLQTVLRTARDVLGESHAECYPNGECVMEYKTGELVTYREEALCARSIEGCGLTLLERRRREAWCEEMSEDFEQKCKRSEEEGCSFILDKMEEYGAECEVLQVEKRDLQKRNECGTLRKRFDELCGRSAGKRALTDECGEVLADVEDSDCEEDELIKRADDTCDEGWDLNDGNCYKYFAGPLNFVKAQKECEDQSSDKSSHLATLERAIVSSDEDRAFFNGLIESSGAVDAIDAVLSQMSDQYNNSDWQDMIDYYDNWAWIGVKYVDDEWRWVSAKKEKSDWNDLKAGQSDWYTENPTSINSTDVRTDHGNCVTYFQDGDSGDDGGWWNVACSVELPFLCEKDPN